MNLITLLFLSLLPYLTAYIGLYCFSDAWLAILMYHFVIVLLLIIRNKKLEQINYSIHNKKLLVFGLTLILFILPILMFLWDYIKLDIDLKQVLHQFNLTGISFVLFILYFSTVHPILEELFWRFAITYDKNKQMDYVFDILFAGYHIIVLFLFVKIPFVILSSFTLIAAGMAWRYIKNKYNDHLTLFLTHSIADLVIILAVYMISRQ